LHTVAAGTATGSTLVKLQAARPPSCGVTTFGPNQPVTVQVPTSLKVISSQVISNTRLPGCLPTYFGIAIQINYQVLDQHGANLTSASMEPQEQVLNEVINGDKIGNPEPTWADIWNQNYPGSTQFTNASGQFLDAPFGACALTGFVDTFTQPTSMLVNGTNYPVRTSNSPKSSRRQNSMN
jgi:hypothetical protein